MKLVKLLEDRSRLLRLQQQLAEALPDTIDVELDTIQVWLSSPEVVTVRDNQRAHAHTYALMPTTASLDYHQNISTLWGSNVDGRVSILCGNKNRPVDIHGPLAHESMRQQPWLSFKNFESALQAIEPLLTLTESRSELLHLQQRLVDDLPDDIDTNTIEHHHLGPCIELLAGGKLLRMVRPSGLGKSMIEVASHQNQHWSAFSYDGVVRLTARSSKLTEANARTELLHLQQRLIDDLPDEVKLDLVHSPRLGEVICVEIWSDGPTKRFVKPPVDHSKGTVIYTPNEFTDWQLFSYGEIVRRLTAAVKPKL